MKDFCEEMFNGLQGYYFGGMGFTDMKAEMPKSYTFIEAYGRPELNSSCKYC